MLLRFTGGLVCEESLGVCVCGGGGGADLSVINLELNVDAGQCLVGSTDEIR